ncbi:MAG: hypothetical protein ABSC34_01745 [Acidimicrobiales bacterium]
MAVDDLLNDLPGIAILLREARGAYGAAIREAVALAGMQPLPVNGPLIVGGLHEGVPFDRLVSQRRQSIVKYETIERLFEAGYLSGAADNPMLTESGHEVSHVMMEAVTTLTGELRARLGDDGMESFLVGLLYLIEVKESREEEN